MEGLFWFGNKLDGPSFVFIRYSKTMKKLLIYLFLFMTSISLYAIPARPFPFVVVQSDGNRLTVCLHGDEYFHYATTSDGVPLMQCERGYYYYAQSSEGRLVRTDILAHDASQRGGLEKDFVKNNMKAAVEVLNQSISNAAMARGKEKEAFFTQQHVPVSRRSVYSGKKKGLVILVNFADLSMFSTTAQHDFDRQFNERGYSDNGHSGSVSDYFFDQSYGKFDLDFDVVGPFTVSKPYSYYGENDYYGNDTHAAEMVMEACRMADEVVNFADYDWDGDGEVEQVYVVYAGYAESSGAASNTIWPHKSTLSGRFTISDGDGVLTLDGVTVDTYACSSELDGVSGTVMRGIGTACHEFSHCLGLPDVYDVKYNGGIGMQCWDLMGGGSYNGPKNNGERPIGYNAYERMSLGWLELTELSDVCRIIDMPCLDDEPVAYVLYNDNNRDEMFVLENRQNGKWFSFIDSKDSSHGMLITHIDYSEQAWSRNRVNTQVNHQRFSFVPADNSYGKKFLKDDKVFYKLSDEELVGDLFPGISGVEKFTDDSHSIVGGKLFNANAAGGYTLGKPITNIREIGRLISFDVMGGVYVPVPTDLHAEQCATDSIRLFWTNETLADSSLVELCEVRLMPALNVCLSEDFSKFKGSESSDDGTFDLSALLNLYTSVKGWKGKYVFSSPFGVKIGEGGYLQTPLFDISNEGVTASLVVKAAGSNGAKLRLTLCDVDGGHISSVVFDDNGDKSVRINFGDMLNGRYCLRITCDTSFYVSTMSVYDGNYTDNDFVLDATMSLITGVDRRTHTVKGDDTTCSFGKMKAKKYKYRVKAMKDGGSSKWTKYGVIKMGKTPNVINGVAADASMQQYYSVAGVKLDDSVVDSRRGVLIVKDHGKVKKTMIK